MDIIGARLLAARLLRVGTPIELVSESTSDSPLQPGDHGTVQAIGEDGCVTVLWDRGLTAELDPSTASFRTYD